MTQNHNMRLIKIVKISFLLVLFASPFFAVGQQKDTIITHLMYRDRVLNYSQELKMAEEGASQAESGYKAIRSGMLPQLSGELNYSHMLKKISFAIGSTPLFVKPYNYGANLTATQNVFAGGVVRKQKDVAEIQQGIANKAVEMTIENIIYSADYAYWSATAIAAYLQVSKKFLSILQETLSLVKERYDNGLTSKNDLLLIQTRVSEAELAVSQVESNYKSAIIGLNTLMGLPPETPFHFGEDVTIKDIVLPSPYNIEQVLSLRPEYLIAQNQVNRTNAELRVTKSDYLPTLAVGVSGDYATKSLNFDGEAILNGVAFAALKVPIFSGNSRKHRVAISKSAIRSSEYELQSVKDQVVREVAVAWSNLTENAKQVEISNNNLKIANESLDLNSYSYSEGLLSILDLMQAQISWLSAYNSFIQANYNYRVAYTDYEKYTGNSLLIYAK